MADDLRIETARQRPAIAFGSTRAALRGGLRDALGVPALVLGASFLGFGALVQQAGLTVWHGLYSTATGWALPGQVAVLELYSVGAPLLLIALAVALVNVRLLPMTIAIMPLLRARGMPRWAYYVTAHWIAVTAWAAAMRVCPHLPAAERLPYFAGMGAMLWAITLGTTATGFLLAGAVPGYVTLGLVFLNPIYFMLVFAADVRHRPRVVALVLGALAGPPLYLLTPDWSLLLAGVIAGTAAFFATRAGKRRSG
jgi:predicted branched-subunit amino acid permease